MNKSRFVTLIAVPALVLAALFILLVSQSAIGLRNSNQYRNDPGDQHSPETQQTIRDTGDSEITRPTERDKPSKEKADLDCSEEFQPPSILGDGFPFPCEEPNPYTGKADLDRYREFQPPSILGDGFPYP
jgi:hypothetical protein